MQKNNTEKWKVFLEKTGFSFLILFFICSFISKAAVNGFGSLLLLLSFVYIGWYKRDILKINRFLIVLLFPYVVGFLMSLFSLAGPESAIKFLNRYKFILIFLPLAAFIDTRKRLDAAFIAIIISAVIASSYGIYKYMTESLTGMWQSFQPGRLSDMLTVVILIHIVFLFKTRLPDPRKNVYYKSAILAFIILFFTCMVMTQIRGAWVGFVVALTLFALFFNKRLFLIICMGIIVIICLPKTSEIKKEIMSIKDFTYNPQDTRYARRCTSNVYRIHLWKTGLDFTKENLLFGTGVDNAREPFENFFFSQSENYQKTYKFALRAPGNMHNSYLQILVEAGLLYLLIYMASLFYVLIQLLKYIKKSADSYVTAALITSAGFLTSQFFHGELFSYGVYAYYLALFGGCFVITHCETSTTLKPENI